jgi:tripeptide aminopeptidase
VQATQRAVAVVTRAPRVTFAGSGTDSNRAMSRGNEAGAADP